MTKIEARQMAKAIVGALDEEPLKTTAYVATWLDTPGVHLTIHLDGRRDGLRYDVHHIVGQTGCKVRLISGDGRMVQGFKERVVGIADWTVDAIAAMISEDRMSEIVGGNVPGQGGAL